MPHFWNPYAINYQIVWEAWATFAVGLLAVAGAVWIGLRQAGIAKRQADITDRQVSISERQVALDEARFRAELYGRRYEMADAIYDFIGMTIDKERDTKKIQAFQKAWGQSSSLFGDDVAEVISKVYGLSISLTSARTEFDNSFDDNRSELMEKVRVTFADFTNMWKEFNLVLKPYMSIHQGDRV